ncbi:MAG: tripartite tricarboxylate transporter substrate binding protein [Betaproteobacteria bacterium]|nr:tripartite tricarboxylate transporter substrate binding protein [Betaproteobacteria bacterium]
MAPHFTRFAIACLAVILCPALPAAAAWPERPVKILIGYAPGGSTDVVARLLAPKLGERLGQPIVIENKPGGAGDFAAEVMLQGNPDGYMLLMTTVAVHAINPGLYKTRKFHPIDDFTPIAMIGSYPMILIASTQTTFKTPAQLKELAATTPTFYASSGVGSPGHLAGELLVRAISANITHVPYKGGSPSVLAVLTGEAQLSFATLPAVVPQIRGGKVRAIGLASRERNPAVPDVPTLIELGLADFEVGTWTGFVGPKGLPPEVVQKLNAAVAAVLVDPVIRKRLIDEGAEIRPMSPADFGAYMRAENVRWSKIIKEAGVVPQ